MSIAALLAWSNHVAVVQAFLFGQCYCLGQPVGVQEALVVTMFGLPSQSLVN